MIRPAPGGRRRPRLIRRITPAPLPQAEPTRAGIQRLAARHRRLAVAATAGPAAHHTPRARSAGNCASASCRNCAHSKARARRRDRDGAVAAGTLRAVRQHRRHRAQHALGRRKRLGKPGAGGDFHHGARGTDQFFDQLRQMRKAPDKFLPVIELMFSACRSASWAAIGRRAATANSSKCGPNARRDRGAAPAADPELSRRWRGVAVPHQPTRHGVPVWVAFPAAAAVCGALFVLDLHGSERGVRWPAGPRAHCSARRTCRR